MSLPSAPTVSFAPEGRPAALELFRTVNRHRLLFATVAVSVTALAVGVTELLPTRYTALASVVVAPLSPDPLAVDGRGETLLRDDEVATQAALITSRDLALQVVARQNVDASPGVAGHVVGQVCALAGPLLEGVGPCRPRDQPTIDDRAESFLARLRAVPAPRTRLIDLAYTDPDPTIAASALNALVDLYQKQQIAQRSADLSRTSSWISDRAETLRRTWLEAEAKAGQYRTQNALTPGISREGSTPLVTQQVASAATSLSSAQAELAAARARYAALKSAGTSPERLSFVLMRDEPGMVLLNNQLTQLRVQMADMKAQYNGAFPGFATLQNQITALEKQVAGEIARALHAVEVELKVKQSLVANLGGTLGALRTEAGDLNAQQVQLTTLEDEARSARTVFETFLARARQLDDRAGLLTSQVQFAAHATSPDLPSFPNRPRFWLGGGVLGLVLGFAACLTRDLFARGFSNISRIGRHLSVPFLCAIPAVTAGRGGRRLPGHVHEHPFSVAAESMRTLLTHFQLDAAPDEAIRTVVVASATGQEGKTTTAIWLASTAARGGGRVLLIDGDHRRGTIARRLHGGTGPGFSDVVFHGADPQDAVQHDAVQGFDFIAAGPPVARSFDRADVDRLRDTLAGLATRYDLVIIDTPPLLAMTDAFLYASLVDGTVFLCRWSRTSREAVSGCLARLQAARARVLGIALSMVDQARLSQFSDELTPYDMRVMKRYAIR